MSRLNPHRYAQRQRRSVGMRLTLSSVTLGALLAAAVIQPYTIATPAEAQPAEIGAFGLDHSDQPVDPHSVPVDQRLELLGTNWAESTDIATAAIGDAEGFTIYRAAASEGYAWSPLATLSIDGIETDRWIGNTCLTQDGSKMGVVYGTRSMTNDERQFDAGAWGAIIDMESGEVTTVGRGFSLAYFNPGCGTGNDIVMTAFTEDLQTRLVRIDANSAGNPAITEVVGEVFSAVPTADGFAAGVAGNLVSVSPDGIVTAVAPTDGVPYDITIGGGGSVGYVDRKSDSAVAHIVPNLSGVAKVVKLATAPEQDLALTRDATGSIYVATTTAQKKTKLPQDVKLLNVSPGTEVSSRGELLIASVSNLLPPVEGDESTEVEPSSERPKVTLVATSVITTSELTFEVDVSQSKPLAEVADDVGQRSLMLVGDPHNPVEAESWCAIPRNDPANQAMQPKPRQVEWAVNQAVVGELDIARSSPYLAKANLNGSTPQGLFPLPSLLGGGSVPSQVMLGIIAQESNLWQASRYTTPGVTGNPLIGNFYGNDQSDDGFTWTAHFDDSDCGYGVSQVTDGMRKAGHEKTGETALSPIKQRAVALDYASNVAAGLQILVQKWNQTRGAGLTINDGEPEYLENWFFAVWAYNSGFYPQSAAGENEGAWGVGWSNNPANPRYDQNRAPFLEDTPYDAAHPQDWPYPEKVMGFAAHSYELYEDATHAVAAFRPAWWTSAYDRSLVKPPVDLFCVSTVNDCDPADEIKPTEPGLEFEPAGPCGHKNSTNQYDLRCWYHGNASWKDDCSSECGNEFVRFDPGWEEQADGTAFAPVCARNYDPADPMSRGLPNAAIIVDDTSAPSLRAGCSRAQTQGSFQFTFGSGLGGYPSKIDTHQLGAGFNSHFYFAHTRLPDSANSLYNSLEVEGKWSLGSSLAGTWTRVYVHVPDHGAWTQQATYVIDLGNGQTKTRTIQQRTSANDWIPLGVFQMAGVPSVTLSNLTADGEGLDDIAWDAVAFQPLPAKPTAFVVAMGDSFSSGEGSSEEDGSDFYPESDNNGYQETSTPDPFAYTSDVEYNRDRNACHRSSEAWSRKATLPGMSSTIGSHTDTFSSLVDYHLIACSGAVTANMLPGSKGKFRELSQLDSGFLDENTTLVTISIGGNDARFAEIIQACVMVVNCSSSTLSGDSLPMPEATANRIANKVHDDVLDVLGAIHDRAPNAKILLMGYPKLFESSGGCLTVGIGQWAWLAAASDQLTESLGRVVDDFNAANTGVATFADPSPQFAGHNLCTSIPAINPFVFGVTPGDDPILEFYGENVGWVSAQSVHPNKLGTDLYAQTMNLALQ